MSETTICVLTVRRVRRYRWLPWPRKTIYEHAPVHHRVGDVIYHRSTGEVIEVREVGTPWRIVRGPEERRKEA